MMAEGIVNVTDKQILSHINSVMGADWGELSQVPLDSLVRFKTILEIIDLVYRHNICISLCTKEDILNVYPPAP